MIALSLTWEVLKAISIGLLKNLGWRKILLADIQWPVLKKQATLMLTTVWLKMHTMPLLLLTLLVKSVLKSLPKSFRVLGLFQLIYHMKNMIR